MGTAERERVVDFTFPFYHDSVTIAIRRPTVNSKFMVIFEPFTLNLWLSIICAFFCVTLLLWLFTRYSPYYWRNGQRPDLSHGLFDIINVITYIYGALLTQGGVHLPSSASGRFLVSFWWLFSVMCAAAYTGNLIAFMTVTKVTLPFNNLDELAKQTSYEYGTVLSTAFYMQFREAKEGTYKEIYKGINRRKGLNVNNYEDGLTMAKNSRYAYIAEKSYLDIKVNEDCELVTVKKDFYPLLYAIGVPEGAEYLNLLSDRIIKMRDNGLLEGWKRKWWPKNQNCRPMKTTEAKPATLNDTQGAFYVLSIGIGFSCILLLIEKFLHWHRMKKVPPFGPEDSDHPNNDLNERVPLNNNNTASQGGQHTFGGDTNDLSQRAAPLNNSGVYSSDSFHSQTDTVQRREDGVLRLMHQRGSSSANSQHPRMSNIR